MTRYWDSWAESLELVMRFISCRNWSSVGVVAIVGIFFNASLWEEDVFRCVCCYALRMRASLGSRFAKVGCGCGLEVVCARWWRSTSCFLCRSSFQTETKEILINNDMSRLILIQCWSSGAARHSFTRKPRKCVIEWESAVFDAFDKGSLHTKHYWLWAFVMLS